MRCPGQAHRVCTTLSPVSPRCSQAEAEFEEHEACSRLRGVLERVQEREGELRAEEDGGAASAQADGGRSIRDSLRDC